MTISTFVLNINATGFAFIGQRKTRTHENMFKKKKLNLKFETYIKTSLRLTKENRTRK
jgi:hypothetical protein